TLLACYSVLARRPPRLTPFPYTTLFRSLVKHRSSLKHRVHSMLLAWGKPCPVSDLFGRSGRELLRTLNVPEPWRSHVETAQGLRSEEHTSELQSPDHLVCRLLLEKKKLQ